MSNTMKAANMLARAASDPEFRERFKSDPVGVSKECGVEIHPHANYRVLEDQPGLRHIVVTEAKHGVVDVQDLPAKPTIAEIRRWAIGHVQAGDATGGAIRTDINAAIAAAGAVAPDGTTFELAVDDDETMNIAIPALAASEVSLDEADMYAGAGIEHVSTNIDTHVEQSIDAVSTEVAVAETTELTVTETTELQDCETTTTVAAEVEIVVVPGFIT